ncbi:MAG: hypothetical protein PHH28_01635 [Desulfuromonadaceae bacterium]|nr:hypothetical protein [Desulfuromonadaceae bacterium]
MGVKVGSRLTLYFVEYPVNVTEDWWKDGEGKEQPMYRMGLDHLKACIKTVEKGINNLKDSGRNLVIIDALMPLAQQKLAELKAAFEKKINSY